MIVTSWNVNGIRACVKKGAFQSYLKETEPDVLFLQETKAMEYDIPDFIRNPSGYHGVWHSAERKGYSGVGVLTKKKPNLILEGFGVEKFDKEGRVISVHFDKLVILGVYFPNGQRDDERLQYKLDFYQAFFDYCKELEAEGNNVIVCGDYNTAHKAIDLARPKENEKSSGFLPIEREWMDKIETDYEYVDTFRAFNQEPNQYTWWAYRSAARKRNVGWRIDYCWVNKAFLPNIKNAFIQQDVLGSDHCPVGIEIAI